MYFAYHMAWITLGVKPFMVLQIRSKKLILYHRSLQTSCKQNQIARWEEMVSNNWKHAEFLL